MLTIQFVPYTEIEDLSSGKKIRKLLNIVKEDKIVLLEGKLSKHEETELIEKTMEAITARFKGIEIAVIYPERKNLAFFKKMKTDFVNILLGDRQGFTVIGPATIIKEIKKDPNKVQLLTKDVKPKKLKKKKK